jgi:hypothetical protein
VTLEVKPTSLNRGEGLAFGSSGKVGVERVRAGVVVERWWWTKEDDSNHDGVDGGLKLCSPSKITRDINACRSDDKIKSSTIL